MTYLDAIVNEALTGAHVNVKARAGCGKSTTAKAIFNTLDKPHNSLYVAFNKHNAQSIDAQIKGDARTLHSLGMSRLHRITKPVVTEYKGRALAKALNIPKKRQLDFETFWETYRMLDAEPDSYIHYSQVQDYLDFECEEFYDDAKAIEEEAVKMFIESGRIDFTDMLWLPRKLQLPKLHYSTVLLDEGHDVSRIGMHMLSTSLREGTQTIILHDPMQNIYRLMNCTYPSNGDMWSTWYGIDKTLPLPLSYRCPSAVVAEANRYVSDMLAAREGGSVERIYSLPDTIPEGAVIIGAKYEDITPNFIAKKIGGDKCILRGHNYFEDALKEAKKGVCDPYGQSFSFVCAQGREKIQEKYDKTPITLAGMAKRQNFQNMITTLTLLEMNFSSLKDAETFAGLATKGNAQYTFSSIHRYKGDEAPVVYFLNYDKWALQALQGDEAAAMLCYVGVTRSSDKLYLVG